MLIRLLAACLLTCATAFAQTPSPLTAHPNTTELAPRWSTGYWDARWIIPGTSQSSTIQARQYGVYQFRKTIEIPQKPAQFMVHVSADNRYRLFVNGKAVGFGPARSDTQNWHYETYDLAPYLQTGPNIIAAQVWYLSDSAPFAQMSYQLGFIMQGDGDAEKIINTGSGWKAYQNPAYAPRKAPNLNTYLVVGDGDRVDAARYPWGWETLNFDDAAWPAAQPLWFAAKTRGFGTDGNWALARRTIPMMEDRPDRLKTVRRAEYVKMPDAFLAGKSPVTIPAQTRAVFLLDQGYLTNAYPELTVSGGKGATVTLAYAEALVDANRQKGNRNDIEGRKLIGIEDQFLPDGAVNRLFRPLWFRTYRYLQVTVETSREPLILNDLIGQFTGYPFQEKAAFASSDSTLRGIWDAGWRTARLCAGETYFDCPYYEQLQYVGDTRVQSMISLYVAGDDRLMRKAILDYDHSRFNEGLTQSRYPSADFQVIPTFSLFWVCMIHDYWMHRQDDNFVKQLLPGIASVLAWHEARLDKSGLNGTLEWWNFVDWCWPWNEAERTGGVPPGSRVGGSSILTLQQAYTLDRAADLMAHYGQNDQAAHYRSLSLRMKKAVQERCYDASRNLMADTPDKKTFSQHANILAVLTDAVPVAQQRALLQRAMTDTSLTQATFYFKFYLFQALKKTGMGDQLIPQLQPWRTMLNIGLTTFAEQPEPTRSDCHAWSASPVYEFISTVCGINSAEPGFRSVRIEPFLGELKTVSGRMPHPLGEVSVQFMKTPTGNLTGTVTLPLGLTGTLRWNGKTQVLVSGTQAVVGL